LAAWRRHCPLGEMTPLRYRSTAVARSSTDGVVKLEFHGTDTDTDTDILVDLSDKRAFPDEESLLGMRARVHVYCTRQTIV